MTVAISGSKNAVLDELDALLRISDDTRAALEKLNIREILSLKQDVRNLIKQGGIASPAY